MLKIQRDITVTILVSYLPSPVFETMLQAMIQNLIRYPLRRPVVNSAGENTRDNSKCAYVTRLSVAAEAKIAQRSARVSDCMSCGARVT
jgi:hypothetical protein